MCAAHPGNYTACLGPLSFLRDQPTLDCSRDGEPLARASLHNEDLMYRVLGTYCGVSEIEILCSDFEISVQNCKFDILVSSNTAGCQQ